MATARAALEEAVLQLERGGFVAPREEACELLAAAGGDSELLRQFLERRLDGEPLAWILGFVVFLGHRVAVERGVYVPRPQTEALARRAIELLPGEGLAADLCTGSGAIAVALRRARPGARVVATDIDPVACGCAKANGVEVYQGHLGDPLPRRLVGSFDVVVAVVPYVPGDELIFLPRDVRRHEPAIALDGGADGVEILEQAVRSGSELLRPGGSLILELGGTQDRRLSPVLRAAGFRIAGRFVDDEGDLRGIEARRR